MMEWKLACATQEEYKRALAGKRAAEICTEADLQAAGFAAVPAGFFT